MSLHYWCTDREVLHPQAPAPSNATPAPVDLSIRLREKRSSALSWPNSYLRLAGNEGMDKKMEITIMGDIGTTDDKDPILHS